ncbi:SbcC/MukB-like Walker B domain-containing protein [Steroidobacter cummioxidans]|uniref:SbcC/MukB-like Walker B domain-containing protein n=1 Tax=Steroidobacter cummioxidans TaxID=1803913 RepID=UPI000E31A481|nr:SbcC/MukB-like Walker B domain-containing protein [Steroidobacter cummioxidans]
MKLSKLITLNWGTLEDREWELPDTLLLTGESGSGKSTLLDAIQTLLTATRAGLYHFNVGQDESTQSRRGGKEPRTLSAYALGQVADGVFIRARATTYIAAVFEASVGAGEIEQPFTALIGIDAVQEGNKAELLKIRMLVVRRPLDISHLLRQGTQPIGLVPLKDIYVHLQSQLKVGAECLQSFEDNKGRYLQHLYGAFMGKAYVPEQDAFRAARAIVKAMAYKELGNVHDLVRDEILDANDFSEGLTRLRELMQSMARLKADAERLRVNISRLKSVDERCCGVLDVAQRFVVSTFAHALRVQYDAETALESVQRSIAVIEKKNVAVSDRKRRLQEEKSSINEQIDVIAAKLAKSDIAREHAALRFEATQLESRFRPEWHALRQAAGLLDSWITRIEQLRTMDLSALPSLAKAAEALAVWHERIRATWTLAMREGLCREASIGDALPELAAAQIDADWSTLVQRVRSDEDSVTAIILQAQLDARARTAQLKDEEVQLSAELRVLQSGRSPAPLEVREALRLIERELPQAEPKMLAQYVEPRANTSWQPAIEGYMSRDRFALIVSPESEAAAIRLVRRKCPPGAAKIVQGAKAIEDTRGTNLGTQSVIHELQCSHPIAKAYLWARYGRVRKVATEEELRRTPQGLMEQGIGSRGYGMFSCWMEEHQLAFGEASRKRRMAWCERRLLEIRDELQVLDHQMKSLKQLAGWFAELTIESLTPRIEVVQETQRLYATNQRSLAALDTSSIDALERERQRLREQFNVAEKAYEEEIGKLAVQAGKMKELQESQSSLREQLPRFQADAINAATWTSRFAAVAHAIATETQLRDEAEKIARTDPISTAGLGTRSDNARSQLGSKLQEVRDGVDMYLSSVRTEDERFNYADPPRQVDRIEDVLRAVLSLRERVSDQLRRQESIGLAQNLHTLTEAETSFNAVFTTGFCFKVRDDVRTGLTTLTKLNRELKNLRFGYDTYELDWDWVPQFKQYYEFFETLDGIVETLEKDKVSIFDSPRLSPEHRATAGHIRDLLLSEDQTRSERSLRELADYRNYRRYDIIRRNDSGVTKLSTWGTGSGGELETPFYVIRAAVLAHALGHFGRDRDGAAALRLMLSDEAFAKMDESRSRSVLRFLSQNLKLQLIVAMPTSKSGAVKPEFGKEFTFSKVSAKRDGKILFVSEAQEKWLKQDALQRLWNQHAEAARQKGKISFEHQSQPVEQPQGGAE